MKKLKLIRKDYRNAEITRYDMEKKKKSDKVVGCDSAIK